MSLIALKSFIVRSDGASKIGLLAIYLYTMSAVGSEATLSHSSALI
jgi:hypothetical protein